MDVEQEQYYNNYYNRRLTYTLAVHAHSHTDSHHSHHLESSLLISRYSEVEVYFFFFLVARAPAPFLVGILPRLIRRWMRSAEVACSSDMYMGIL